MPVARTMKRYEPWAMVPVLMLSVVFVPFLLGVTEVEPNVTGPAPAGSGPSTDNVTALPKAGFLLGEFCRVRGKSSVSGSVDSVTWPLKAWLRDTFSEPALAVRPLVGSATVPGGDSEKSGMAMTEPGETAARSWSPGPKRRGISSLA